MSKFRIKRISRVYLSEGTRFKRVVQLHCGLKKGLKLVVLWVDDKIKTSEGHTFETPFRPVVQYMTFMSQQNIYLTIIPRALMGSESIAHEAGGRMGYRRIFVYTFCLINIILITI